MNLLRPLLLTTLLLLTLALPSLASVPTTLSYQGTLTDKAGTGITGSRTLVFSLYNVATGGTALWTETQTLTIANGRFGAILGVITSLDVSMLGGDTWLGIAVQGEPEMAPRQKLTSVAYAMKAAVAESVASTDSLIPAGTVVAFAGAVAPSGWLLCDGTAVSRTTYSRLYTAIGNAHGYGDNTTTFNLPDYRGRFLRGVDGTAGNDPDKTGRTSMKTGGTTGNAVGSVQGDIYGSHQHNPAVTGTGGGYLGSGDTAYSGGGGEWFGRGGTPFPTAYSGGNETRPKNAYVNWIIKY